VATVHKGIEVQMEDQSVKPTYKFTDLCREVMRIKSPALTEDGTEGFVFDAIIPIILGVHRGGATASYQTDCAYSAALVTKIKKSAAAWFFGYWLHICKYRLVMVWALMESFSIEAAYLASYSSFDPKTLTVNTEYADDDELLEGVEVDLGIDQGWEADKEENGEATVDVVGHCKALTMALRDRINIEDADRSGPSRRSDFSQSTGNSTNNSDATTRQHLT
jgi:hypothetical protein